MTTDCEKKTFFTTRHLTQSYDSCDLSRRVQVGYDASKFIKNVARLLQYKTTTLTECDATNADVLKLLSGCSFNLTDEYSDNVPRPLPSRHLYEVGHTWTTLKTSRDISFSKQKVICSIRCNRQFNIWATALDAFGDWPLTHKDRLVLTTYKWNYWRLSIDNEMNRTTETDQSQLRNDKSDLYYYDNSTLFHRAKNNWLYNL